MTNLNMVTMSLGCLFTWKILLGKGEKAGKTETNFKSQKICIEWKIFKWKILLEKEKMLVTSIFSYSSDFFQKLSQRGQLILSQTSPGFYMSVVQVF